MANHKKFSCPLCGKKFPISTMATLKSYITCKSCNTNLKVKCPITFQIGVCIGFFSFSIPYYILFYKGWGFWEAAGIGSLFSFISIIGICIGSYFSSTFEKL